MPKRRRAIWWAPWNALTPKTRKASRAKPSVPFRCRRLLRIDKSGMVSRYRCQIASISASSLPASPTSFSMSATKVGSIISFILPAASVITPIWTRAPVFFCSAAKACCSRSLSNFEKLTTLPSASRTVTK